MANRKGTPTAPAPLGDGHKAGFERRKLMLEFIDSYIAEHGYSPSVLEVGEAVGLASKASTHQHLLRLAKDGLISWEPSRPRTLRRAA